MGGEDFRLEVGGSSVKARVHRASGYVGVVWVFGAGGGLGGPAGGVYERLAARLQPLAISSLQVDYRRPAALAPCVEDTLAGVAYLNHLGMERVMLVGHSFGGSVVINAAAASGSVIGVAALSSQSYRTEVVSRLSPKSLLVMHGEDDEVLPCGCSLDIYRRAKKPKRIILYPGCRHGLDECRNAIDRDLMEWILETIAVRAAA